MRVCVWACGECEGAHVKVGVSKDMDGCGECRCKCEGVEGCRSEVASYSMALCAQWRR